MDKQTIEVQFGVSTVSIKAEVIGEIAVHRAPTHFFDGKPVLSLKKWSVTHVPRGTSFCFAPDRATAVRIAERLHEYQTANGVDWATLSERVYANKRGARKAAKPHVDAIKAIRDQEGGTPF